MGKKKGGDNPNEETNWLLPGIETIPLQLQLGEAEGVITGLFKGTDGTTLSKCK